MCVDMVLFISRIMVCFDTCGLVCSVMSCRHVMHIIICGCFVINMWRSVIVVVIRGVIGSSDTG